MILTEKNKGMKRKMNQNLNREIKNIVDKNPLMHHLPINAENEISSLPNSWHDRSFIEKEIIER